MGSKLTCMNEIISVAGYRLNVTVRFDVGLLSVSQREDVADSEVDEQKLLNNIYKLIHVTVSKWLLVARAYEQYQTDKTKPDIDVLGQSAEIDLFTTPIFSEEPLVTVWAHGSEPLTLHSHSNPYSAFILWCAFNAYKSKHEDQRRVPAPNAPATLTAQPAQAQSEAPTLSTDAPTEGTQYIGAYDHKQQFPAGQILEFDVWGIGSAFTKSGQAQWVFRCEWNGAMSQYDAYGLSIYQDNERTPEAVREYLSSLNVGVEPTQGRWRYVARVAHSKGKQYINVIKIEPRDGEAEPVQEQVSAEEMPF